MDEYATGAQLTLDAARMLEPLGEVVSAFETAQKAAANTQAAIGEMAAPLGGVGRGGDGLAVAFERAERAAGGVRIPVASGKAGGDGVPPMVPGIGRMIGDSAGALALPAPAPNDPAALRDAAFDIARTTPGRNVASVLADFADVRAPLGDADFLAGAKALPPSAGSTAALHAATGMEDEPSRQMPLHAIEPHDGIVDPKAWWISPGPLGNDGELTYTQLASAGTTMLAFAPQDIGERNRIGTAPSREAMLERATKGSIGFNIDAMPAAWPGMLPIGEKANSSTIVSAFQAITGHLDSMPDDKIVAGKLEERGFPGIGDWGTYPSGRYSPADKRFWFDQNQDSLQPNAYRPEEGNHYRPATVSASGGGETLTFRGTVNLDGRKVGEALAHALDRPGTGPSVTSVRSSPWFAESGVGAA